MELTFFRLRWLNVVVGLFQLLTGLAIFGISDYDGKTSLPWYTFFIGSWGKDDAAERALFYVPQPKKVVNFPIGVWSGSFLVLSALNHLLVALPGLNAIYNRGLCANRNFFRWAEYSVSASIMQVMIAQLFGVTDVTLLVCIGALMASCMLFGHQMEVSNGERLTCYEAGGDPRKPPAIALGPDAGLPFITDGVAAAAPLQQAARVDWGPFWMGCWPFVAAVAVTAVYFFEAVSNGDPPTFVWSLFFIIYLLYLLFAVNQALQFKQVRGWTGFAKAELWYILLSITSKQLLAWITYGGTKRLED